MRSVLRSIALLITIIFLFSGCTLPTTTVPETPVTTQDPTTQRPGTPGPIPVGELQVHFIDVGQGDSILILSPDNKAMLIDGGEADSGVVQYLKSKNITRLDLVVATHPHADHIGGLVQVLKTVPVTRVVTNGQPTTTRTYENFLDAIATARAEYAEVKRGDTLEFAGLTFTVLNPVNNKGDDLNNGSVVLRLAYNQVSFLFEGDAEAEAEVSMSVSSFSPVQATILKVAHHGSRSSSTPAFLSLVKPRVAVYCAGKGNSYGHPHPETIAALKAVAAKIYGTDVNGTVVIATNGTTYSVQSVTGQPRGPPTVQPPSTATIIATKPVAKITNTVSATTTLPQLISGTLSLEIVSVTSPIAPGKSATLRAKTAPGASCSITVYYKSGPSSAQGPYTKSADASGNVSWIW